MRKWEWVVVVVIAVLGLAVTGPVSADAAEGKITASAGTTSVSGEGGSTVTFPGARAISCPSIPFSGEVTNGDSQLLLSLGKYSCTSFLGLITAFPTECTYRISDLTAASADKWAVNTKLLCPEGQAVHTKVYLTAGNHEKGIRTCEYDLLPQETSSGLYLIDNTNGTISLGGQSTVLFARTFGTTSACGEATFITQIHIGFNIAPAAGTLSLE